jgi:hypothetical protein
VVAAAEAVLLINVECGEFDDVKLRQWMKQPFAIQNDRVRGCLTLLPNLEQGSNGCLYPFRWLSAFLDRCFRRLGINWPARLTLRA